MFVCIVVSPQAMFVGYQLLRAISDLHRVGVPCGDLRLGDVWVDGTLWLRLRPRLADCLCPAPERAAQQRGGVVETGETEGGSRTEAERWEEEEFEDKGQSLSELTQVGAALC